VGESRRVGMLLLALSAPALVWSCGSSSETGSGNPGAGGSAKAGASSAAGSPATSQGGSTTGGKAGAGGASAGTASGGGGQAVGGVAAAGAGMGGGDAGSGGDTGAGGAAPWDPELLGFECGSKRCSLGQACIFCSVEGSTTRICVPNPSDDPAGFATATAACVQPLTKSFNECDGPEDCPKTRYCVAAEGEAGFMRCRDEPSSAGGSCCFACGASTDCTLCRSAADCPDNVACEPAQSAPAGVMGCARRR
jgi:hypothetical protein